MTGPIDPESIYTKQSCIGENYTIKFTDEAPLGQVLIRLSSQVVEVLARSTKGTWWKPQLDTKEGLLTNHLLFDFRVDRRTGESVAIKIIDVENAEDEVDDIIQEIAILSELKSPYVTKYHGSYLKGSHLWIVMEYCSGGSCHDLLLPGPIHEEYIAIILRELLKGLEYLHGDHKLHRDIKGNRTLA